MTMRRLTRRLQSGWRIRNYEEAMHVCAKKAGISVRLLWAVLAVETSERSGARRLLEYALACMALVSGKITAHFDPTIGLGQISLTNASQLIFGKGMRSLSFKDRVSLIKRLTNKQTNIFLSAQLIRRGLELHPELAPAYAAAKLYHGCDMSGQLLDYGEALEIAMQSPHALRLKEIQNAE